MSRESSATPRAAYANVVAAMTFRVFSRGRARAVLRRRAARKRRRKRRRKLRQHHLDVHQRVLPIVEPAVVRARAAVEGVGAVLAVEQIVAGVAEEVVVAIAAE